MGSLVYYIHYAPNLLSLFPGNKPARFIARINIDSALSSDSFLQ